MRFGRYWSEDQAALFFVTGENEFYDWRCLQGNAVPEALRKTVSEALAGNMADFCRALPEIEDFIRENPEFLNSAAPVDAQVIKGKPSPAPVVPQSIICVGLNYSDHAAESGMQLPKAPLLFAKTANALTGNNCPVRRPQSSEQLDFEAELAVVIGRTCRSVAVEQALDYVAGYTCANDISARDFQFADGQWFRGKSADTFAPLGPWLVTPTEVPDPNNLRITSKVNDAVMQDSSTANLIFRVSELIQYVSANITLHAGDVILTGTPPGVGFARKPPVYLRPGDEVVVEIEGIGCLRNTIE